MLLSHESNIKASIPESLVTAVTRLSKYSKVVFANDKIDAPLALILEGVCPTDIRSLLNILPSNGKTSASTYFSIMKDVDRFRNHDINSFQNIVQKYGGFYK